MGRARRYSRTPLACAAQTSLEQLRQLHAPQSPCTGQGHGSIFRCLFAADCARHRADDTAIRPARCSVARRAVARRAVLQRGAPCCCAAPCAVLWRGAPCWGAVRRAVARRCAVARRARRGESAATIAPASRAGAASMLAAAFLACISRKIAVSYISRGPYATGREQNVV